MISFDPRRRSWIPGRKLDPPRSDENRRVTVRSHDHESFDSIERETLLERVLDEAAARIRAGEPPRVEEYAKRHSELADEIRKTLPVLLRLERCRTPAAPGPARADGLVPGRVLGDYRLVRVIGRGGMGVVYEAEQLSLDRRVAFKLLPGDSRDVESLERRFELEARTAARLLHPHITTVHEFGEVDGFAFFAMQFVDGMDLSAVIRALRQGTDPREKKTVARTITEPGLNGLAEAFAEALRLGIIDGRPQRAPVSGSTRSGAPSMRTNGRPSSSMPSSSSLVATSFRRERRGEVAAPGGRYFASVARIGSIVADALSHAHAAGVVHRDIKPSNLLLDRQGKVWVADFGLAKLDDGEGLTQSGDAVGTFRYMGPERFRGWSDPRSDVYSLGATLFELVILEPPFNDLDRAGLIRKIIEDGPPRLRSIDPRVPRDLETIILKCLEKEPAQRYASAGELRDDLDRFLDGRPVHARRSTPLERGWLFVRRNRVVSSLAAALLIVAVVATVSAMRLNETASELRQTVGYLADETNRALENSRDARIAQGAASFNRRDSAARRDVLRSIAQAAASRPSLELRNVAIMWLCELGIDVDSEFQIPGDAPATVSPTGELVAWSVGRDVVVRTLAGGVERRIQRRDTSRTWALEFSPSGEYLACRSDRLSILRVEDGRSVASVGRYARLSFHPDQVVVMDGGKVALRELPSGEERAVPSWAGDASWLAIGPGGKRVALADRSRRVLRIHDAVSGKQLRRFALPRTRLNDPIDRIVWHPGGRLVATGCRPLVVWDIEAGVTRLVNEDVFLQRIAFSSDGELLAATAWPGASFSRFFEPRTGRLVSKLRGEFLGFDLRGSQVFVRHGSKVRFARVGRAECHRVLHVPDSSRGSNFRVAFDPSGRWLATARSTGIHIFDVGGSRRAASLPVGSTVWVDWSEDGDELLSAGPRGTWRWPWKVEQRGIVVGPPRRVCGGQAWNATRGADGRVVVLGPRGIHVHHLDRRESEFIRESSFKGATHLSLSADGRYLACGGNKHGRELHVWDLKTGARVYSRLDIGSARPLFIGETRLLIGSERTCRLLEVGSWKVLEEVARNGLVAAVNGDTLVVGAPPSPSSLCSTPFSATLLDLHHGLAPLAEFAVDKGAELAVGPRGQLLAAGTIEGGPVHLWRLDALRPRLRELGLDWDPPLTRPAPEAPRATLEFAVDLGVLAPAPPTVTTELEKAEAALAERPDDTTVSPQE